VGYRTHRLNVEETAWTALAVYEHGTDELREKVYDDRQGNRYLRDSEIAEVYRLVKKEGFDDLAEKILRSNTDWLEAQDIAYPGRTHEEMVYMLYKGWLRD